MTTYDAILFDNDGVLVDPPAHDDQVAAIHDAFDELGIEPVDDDHVTALTGGVTPDLLAELERTYDVDREALWDARERHDERSQFEAFRAGRRDSYDDVTALADISQPCGVVSNNHHTTVEFILDRFAFGAQFETYYGRPMTIESISLKKPNTHYLDLAMTDLGGGSALYVGDSESDVVAAERAGMDSAFVRREHSRAVELSTEPTYEVETLHAVRELANDTA
ncbi:HAD family hydrolase [Haloarchaeobius baliensis]|uniref:HAD family hydrolase n=1 Tax=Haloarchaeobius baliensis TaxID=1670458 RepID=UPI003F883EBD